MKTFAIIGDSYSTYKGYVPSDYNYWYAPEGNECENDMPSVEKTWWYMFRSENDLELVANCSFSGSAVCYSGYPDMADCIGSSFVERMKRELGEDRDDEIANGADIKFPQLIIIFGGTNDFWAGSPVGSIKYVDQTEEDLYSFGPAYCHMVEYLKKYNPDSVFINIINDEITGPIRDIMKEVCLHENIPTLELKDISKQNGHPNEAGMRQITDQLNHFFKKLGY